MTRAPGWETRLHDAVESFRARPFAWGSDCVLGLCAACIEAVTGVDLAAEFRGRYSDAAGAMALLQELGLSNAPAALAAHFPEIPVALAMRGDLAVIEEASADDPLGATGVILGSLVAAYGPNGLHFLPRSAIRRSFRVE